MTTALSILAYYHLLDISIPQSKNVLLQCPSLKHQDDRPSFSVNVSTCQFVCHGCGIHNTGRIQEEWEFQLIRLIESAIAGHEVYDEWKLLQIKAAIDLNIELDVTYTFSKEISGQIEFDTKKLLQKARTFFFGLPQPRWDIIQGHYLQKRGFEEKTLSYFDIRLNHSSYFPIILPIVQNKEFKGYIARRAADISSKETKYLNSPGLSKTSIVGGNLEQGEILVVEGYLDLMKAWQYGYKNVACLFGWHCSDTQADYLRQFATSIVCGLDNDERGEQGYVRLKAIFPSIPVHRLHFQTHIKDVCEMDPVYFNLFALPQMAY